MRQVRSSVFETNSSSVHAIAFSMGGMEESNLPMTRDGKVKVRYGKFGREEAEYNDQETKLSYLITLCHYIANGDEVEGEYLEYYEEHFVTPSGDKMVAFGRYGHDG